MISRIPYVQGSLYIKRSRLFARRSNSKDFATWFQSALSDSSDRALLFSLARRSLPFSVELRRRNSVSGWWGSAPDLRCGIRRSQPLFPEFCRDLQPVVGNILLSRWNDDNPLRWASVGDRFNCPHPAEVAVLVEVPVAAAALHDLDLPMSVVRRDCDSKCNGRRQHHPEEGSDEKYAYFVSFPHFPYSLIAARFQAGSLFGHY
jgi:hypothetical protein